MFDRELEKETAKNQAIGTENDGDIAKVLDENERLKMELGRLRRKMMNADNTDNAQE